MPAPWLPCVFKSTPQSVQGYNQASALPNKVGFLPNAATPLFVAIPKDRAMKPGPPTGSLAVGAVIEHRIYNNHMIHLPTSVVEAPLQRNCLLQRYCMVVYKTGCLESRAVVGSWCWPVKGEVGNQNGVCQRDEWTWRDSQWQRLVRSACCMLFLHFRKCIILIISYNGGNNLCWKINLLCFFMMPLKTCCLVNNILRCVPRATEPQLAQHTIPHQCVIPVTQSQNTSLVT